jgi:hypothetical protein
MTFKPGSYRSKYYDEYESDSSPFASSFLDGGNFLDTSRGYRARAAQEVAPVSLDEGVFNFDGTKALVGGGLAEQQAGMDVANSALAAYGKVEAAKELAAAQKAAASSQASASKTGSIIGAVGSIGGAVAGALI